MTAIHVPAKSTSSTVKRYVGGVVIPADGTYTVSVQGTARGRGEVTIEVGSYVSTSYVHAPSSYSLGFSSINLLQLKQSELVAVYARATVGTLTLDNVVIHALPVDKKQLSKQCDCDVSMLMTRGCQCGGT